MKEKKYYKHKPTEKEIANMEEIIRSRKIDEDYVKELISRQKGELNVSSKYYKGNIREGNWSLIENDLNIIEFDKPKVIDAIDVIYGLNDFSDKPDREKDAEYEYVFIPSYYAVKIMSIFYLEHKEEADKIYGFKNSVLGGIKFILNYIGGNYEDERVDFDILIDAFVDHREDDFINQIIDCISEFYGKNIILERRIKDFNNCKDNWFTIDFDKEMQDLKINCMIVNDYKILMHRDVKKDWKFLKGNELKIANEKISKTPLYPNNDTITDSEKLNGKLKDWLSQRICSHRKDRIVYRVDKKEKKVYIATVCDHYNNAEGRTTKKSISAYK